ncbi:MAG: hypothetical protein ABIR79_05940 [Candidatus Binatia bacterium]
MAKAARPLSEQLQPGEEVPTIELRVLIPMTLGFFLITAIVLWASAVVAVDGVRHPDGRVEVTVEQRAFGLVAFHRVELADVVHALAVQKSGGQWSGSRTPVGAQLQLTLRDGSAWESSPVPRHIVGASPITMAEGIQALIDAAESGATAPTVSLRWIPWLMGALAVPFVLFSTLFAMVWVNIPRRRLSGGAA